MNSADLYKYYDKQNKCVAIAMHNHKTYYAISGEDGSKSNKIAKEIESMIGSKDTVRCFIDKTFTVLSLRNYRSSYYNHLEDYIYHCLYTMGEVDFVFPEYLGSRIQYRRFMPRYRFLYDMTNFSCVERKIIGTVGIQKIEIIVGLRPCYRCLPVIKNVTYYDQCYKKVYSIHSSKRHNQFVFREVF